MGKVLGRIGKAHGLFLRGARARGRSPLDDRRPPARVAWQTRARAQALVGAASEGRGGVTLGLGSGGGSWSETLSRSDTRRE